MIIDNDSVAWLVFNPGSQSSTRSRGVASTVNISIDMLTLTAAIAVLCVVVVIVVMSGEDASKRKDDKHMRKHS